MISDRSYKSILKHCGFTAGKNSEECDSALYLGMGVEIGQVNWYSIYSPSCVLQTNQTKFLQMRLLAEDDPCTVNYAEKYYNRPEVQRAMHANVTSIPYKWTACNDVLFSNWGDSEYSMLPIYKELIATDLRIWVFR